MMKLNGKIGEILLVVLIDSGASHNFISPEVVSGLGLGADKDYQLGVRLSDGHHILTQGRCHAVHGLGISYQPSVFSVDWASHINHLNVVLEILEKNQFVANKSKCNFGKKEIDYLGHIISNKEVAVDPNKVRSVVNWPTPKNVKGVRGFLGLTGYYRRFIAYYGRMAKPLTELTKKNGFLWNSDAQEAFEKLKKAVTSAPVLALPNFSIPFEVECDASGKGVGAVLLQQKRPISFFSRAFSGAHLFKSVYEKELMALVLAVQRWRQYLMGQKIRHLF